MEWESNRVYCDVKFWCSLWITKPNGTTCFITLCGLFLLPLSDLLLLPLSFIFESEKLKNWELAKPRSIKTAHAFRAQQPNLDLESGIPSLTLISGVKWAWAVAGCFLLPSRFLVSYSRLSCAQERGYSLRFSASWDFLALGSGDVVSSESSKEGTSRDWFSLGGAACRATPMAAQSTGGWGGWVLSWAWREVKGWFWVGDWFFLLCAFLWDCEVLWICKPARSLFL